MWSTTSGWTPTSTKRSKVKDGSGVEVRTDSGGDSVGLFATRAFKAGSTVVSSSPRPFPTLSFSLLVFPPFEFYSFERSCLRFRGSAGASSIADACESPQSASGSRQELHFNCFCSCFSVSFSLHMRCWCCLFGFHRRSCC